MAALLLLLLLLLPHGIGATTPQPTLAPCRCDTVGKAPDACPYPQCLCSAPHGPVNASEFHARECRGSAGTTAAAVGGSLAAAAAVVVAVAAVVVWRCRRTAGAAGWGKREPPPVKGQPRYISREAESGPAAVGVCLAPDYENVFVGSCAAPSEAPVRDRTQGWQQKGYSPQAPSDDLYFLESDTGEQPIYANTETPGEDVYVIPDP
ncbi:leucine-rich repeat-containing protein 25 isoform X2 [Numida meleagris]|nr:leucine-rich repeat-containing protein 25 isoform X2 [Numida meleagris]